MQRKSNWWWMLVVSIMLLGFSGCGDGDENSSDGDVDGDIDGDMDAELEGWTPALDALSDEPDLNQKKFALSMFHFNIQYVAGGLETVWNDEEIYLCGTPCKGWTDEKLQDWIITETFEPVLDFYMAHDEYRGTFEMQAMMLEAIAERHPQILQKLQQATEAGRIEMVSFHWSDQFFLAFPEADLVRSIEMTREIFNKNHVTLSQVVFNQEGQAGEGKHRLMADQGYAISVYPKNLFKYVQEEESAAYWPLYQDHGTDVIIGPGSIDPASGIESNWTFFDDGELLMVPADPYLAAVVSADYTLLDEYAQELADLVEQGYKVTSITDFVSHLKAQGIEQKALPKVLDGTWQPPSTESVKRWLGGRSLAPYNNLERDNPIRTSNYRVRTEMEATAILYEHAKEEGLDVTGMDETLDTGYRHLLKAQVTDTTGITPWQGEFNYANDNDAAALQIAQDLGADLMTLLGWEHAQIDLRNKTAEAIDDIPLPEGPSAADAPFEATVAAPGREATLEWKKYDNGIYELSVSFGASEDPTGKIAEKAVVTLTLPRYDDVIRYSPALMEDTVVEYPFSDFDFLKPEVYLPLGNGLIGLGDDWWVIKDCSQVHLAGRVPNETAEEEARNTIQFIDETADPENGDSWLFKVFKGSKQDALQLAQRTNTGPVVYR